MSRALLALLAVVVVAAGAALRLEGTGWDGGQLLHPDERFLLMLAEDARPPTDLAEYLSPGSPLDPHNLGRDFFVYGTLPTTLLVLADAHAGGRDPGEARALARLAFRGRRLAAAAEVATCVLTLAIAAGLARRRRSTAALWAGVVYALAVLPIQAAHFFTVDPFLVLFCSGALALALRAGSRPGVGARCGWAAGAGAALGLALACKLPALLVAPLVAAWIAWPGDARPGALRRPLARLAPLLPAAVAAYLGLRIGDPAFFAQGHWLDPRPAPELLRGLAQLAEWSRPEGFYPPAIQWIDRVPGLYPLANLAGAGLGPAAFGVVTLGVMAGLRPPLLSRRWIAAAWVLLAVVALSLRTVQTLRYFLPLLPVLAALAGLLLRDALQALRPGLRVPAAAVLLALLAAWPLAFRSIYQEPHTRVRASEWIRAHVPAGSSIAHEHWDDRLPLPRGFAEVGFAYRELPVFEPDTDFKWARMQALLEASDYYVLSSNRGYGSIGRVPEKYPRMARFYDELLAGRTPFVLEAEFTSFPRLLGVAFDDQWVEEAFHVYDHPRVLVFRRERR